MQPLLVFSVTPRLPDNLLGLWDLAYNYWFAWNNEIQEIFFRIDPGLWRQCAGNPVLFLHRAPQKLLEDISRDALFLDRLKEANEQLARYLGRTQSPLSIPNDEPSRPAVAYFSLEYGVSLSLPVYSGGLGILAGDHLKSASDLNVPLVGVGLCYQEGYFRQYLNQDGWQQERYPRNDFEEMPLTLMRDKEGTPILISVDLAGETCRARIRRAAVGRVNLYLLDANIPENPAHIRQITSRLYGGDLDIRLRQEILIGIGGMRALAALGLKPRTIHMNEGHSAFAGLERIRTFMADHGLSFEAAKELAASTSIFTTHTPVPAGNDRFPPELMERYFTAYTRDLGLAFKVLLAHGRENPRDDAEPFCMTVLALNLSRFNNGVSKLHGRVSRNMWRRVWAQYPVEDVPIGAITNGVHTSSWIAPDMALLYERYLGGNWREDPDCGRVWSRAGDIPEEELWSTHSQLRARLVDAVRERLKRQLKAKGANRKDLELAAQVLEPDALTIGFARRFATYKRAGLLLSDKERLLRLVTDKERPLQFVFAGKAHPQDDEGKKLIQSLVQFCRREECRPRMVFIEDYDIEIAQHMVQGCDVWLNTPRRPLEACGTSGMKALVNGVLNLSTLDGWWAEAYCKNSAAGWRIGRGEEYGDNAYQDYVESQALYALLENEVVPEFYTQAHGELPRGWVAKMKFALKELVPLYNSHRMVEDYARTAYIPAIENHARLAADGFRPAKELAAWRMDLMTKWDGLAIRAVKSSAARDVYVGDRIRVDAQVRLNNIAAEHVSVAVFAGRVDLEGEFTERLTVEMAPEGQAQGDWQPYVGWIAPGEAGRFGFTVRAEPKHPLLLDAHSLGLIRWAEGRG